LKSGGIPFVTACTILVPRTCGAAFGPPYPPLHVAIGMTMVQLPPILDVNRPFYMPFGVRVFLAHKAVDDTLQTGVLRPEPKSTGRSNKKKKVTIIVDR